MVNGAPGLDFQAMPQSLLGLSTSVLGTDNVKLPPAPARQRTRKSSVILPSPHLGFG